MTVEADITGAGPVRFGRRLVSFRGDAMSGFEAARANMIERQLQPNRVTDERVINAFAGIRRELFVPERLRAIAYSDSDLPLGDGRYLITLSGTARFDVTAEAPWFSYTDSSGAPHTVWFEDAESSKAKFSLAQEAGVGGVYLWMYGCEDTGTWRALRDARPAAGSGARTMTWATGPLTNARAAS